MIKFELKLGMAGLILAGGIMMTIPGSAGASVTSSKSKIVAQLASRINQLGRLTSNVNGASGTLTPAHATLLNGSITTAIANSQALNARVLIATTHGELNTDRNKMVLNNRVFAVLTPQVFQVIDADTVVKQVAGYRANEPSLQADVNDINGRHGYKEALEHYTAFVRNVNTAARDSVAVSTTVLNQTPTKYPKNADVFVKANTKLLAADKSLAQSTYLAGLIGLESGGYAGS
jgi:hypothetical protein